jgi:hypothetical protein
MMHADGAQRGMPAGLLICVTADNLYVQELFHAQAQAGAQTDAQNMHIPQAKAKRLGCQHSRRWSC